MHLIEYPLDQDEQDYPQAGELPLFETATLHRHRVDAHYQVVDGGGLLARASLWWRQVPAVPGEQLGVIGHFEASDGVAAARLLEGCLIRLRQQGCSLVVGPMDGNTWRRYRLVTDPGQAPPFFLEPSNPPTYPDYFRQAGFTAMARYTSGLVTDLARIDHRIPRARQRLRAAGITWRPLSLDRFEAELSSIYRLSLVSFARNLLYTPIEQEEFLAQYRVVAPYLQPELTLLAEQEGDLVGYLFALPDLNQMGQGRTMDTCIIKTVAVLPGRRTAGLGGVLVAECQQMARELGYGRAIHALMHETNRSQNISNRYGHTMRRYTLYQQRLAPGS